MKEQSRNLLKAAQSGDIKGVGLALGAKANINAVTNTGETALILAVSKGHKKIVDLLLSSENIDVNAVNNKGNSALLCAIKVGRSKDYVMALCAHGADPLIRDNYGLRTFAHCNDKEIQRILKDHEAFMKLKYGCVSILAFSAIMISSNPIHHMRATLCAVGLSFYFNGVKSYTARSASIYLSSTVLWCATNLVSEEYSIYCKIGAAAIAIRNIISDFYPYISSKSQIEGI